MEREKDITQNRFHALSHDQSSVKSNFSVFEAEAQGLVTFFGK